MKFFWFAAFLVLVGAMTLVVADFINDSDGGLNIWVKGTCTMANNMTNGTYMNFTDYCPTQNLLAEYYPASNGTCVSTYVIASAYGNSSVCSNGVIVEAPYSRGDMNCDGSVSFFDVDPFVLALSGIESYGEAYPDCTYMLADVNGDLEVDFFDIDPFIGLL